MRTTEWLAVPFVTLLAGPAAGQVPALEQGSLLVGGTGQIQNVDEQGEDDLLNALLSPRVQYFVLDHLAVGGEGTISYGSRGEFSSNTVQVGPAASFYFAREGRLHPFLRGSALFSTSSLQTPSGDRDSDGWAVRGAAGVLFLLNEAVGLEGELFVSRDTQDGPAGLEIEATRTGLAVGVSAFLP